MEEYRVNKPTYNVYLDYYENYKYGPFFDGNIPERIETGLIDCNGLKLKTRVGIPAGPLLNSNWIKLYAKLGFDVLTYKTVRTSAKKSHPLPNCMYANLDKQLGIEDFENSIECSVKPYFDEIEKTTITNSFGVPSEEPLVWMEDVNRAKEHLDKGQVLVVGAMGSSTVDTTRDEWIADYVKCAELVNETEADVIEINLSCPNLVGNENPLYLDEETALLICKKIKQSIPDCLLWVKVGFYPTEEQLESFLAKIADYIDGFAGINTIRMRAVNRDGNIALGSKDREYSGFCGYAIKYCGITQALNVVNIKDKHLYDFNVIGVGGVMTKEDVEEYLDNGVDIVMSATGAMWNPYLAYEHFSSFKRYD